MESRKYPYHGKSLLPVFTKDDSVKHDYLWWYRDRNRAIRIGDWKLVADHNKPWELFDLRADRSETQNLAVKNPEKVQEMEKAWLQHETEFKELAKQDPQKKRAPKL